MTMREIKYIAFLSFLRAITLGSPYERAAAMRTRTGHSNFDKHMTSYIFGNLFEFIHKIYYSFLMYNYNITIKS